MNETQRQAYLDAMDISVWVRKPATIRRDHLLIGPGSGSMLLVCREAGERALPVAADICRYLGVAPVWAWPDPEGSPEHPTLEKAIDQFLYTWVLLMGQSLAAEICKGRVPDVMGSASIVVVPGLDELSQTPAAKKKLWRHISKHHDLV